MAFCVHSEGIPCLVLMYCIHLGARCRARYMIKLKTQVVVYIPSPLVSHNISVVVEIGYQFSYAGFRSSPRFQRRC